MSVLWPVSDLFPEEGGIVDALAVPRAVSAAVRRGGERVGGGVLTRGGTRFYTGAMDEGFRKIVSFVARGTDSGKTTVMEKVIAELKARGLKVCAVKHGMHMHYRDMEGKDTHRFAKSGADRVALFSPEGFLVYANKPPGLDFLVTIAERGMDVVLVEGFKSGPFRKIEVFNAGLYDSPLCIENTGGDYIAIVADTRVAAGVRSFLFGEIDELCDFIEEVTKGPS